MDRLYKKYNNSENFESKALLKGILLGEKEDLTTEQVENFKISNLSHILAVSGMHIAYVILGIMFILKFCGIAKCQIHIITIFVIIFFVFLTGCTPSVIRASIMAILILLSFLFKRKPDVWINLSIASLISLICNPYILFSLSYELSFLGTIGIVCGMKVVKAYKKNKEIVSKQNDKKKTFKKMINTSKKFVIETIAVCISAQFFVFPIILLNFNTVSLYFLLSNLLVAPIIGTIIILGFVVILVSYLIYPLASTINIIEKVMLQFLNIMTNCVSNLPNAIIYLKTPYTLSIVIYFAIILIFVGLYTTNERVIKRKIKKQFMKIVKIFKKFIVAYLIILIVIDLNIFSPKCLKIYFVDVGQGDCTLVITESNKKILIDGGGSNDENYDVGKNTTLPYLLDRRITILDYVIISHFDSDHVQGLFAVLENLKIRNVIISKQRENSENYEKILKIVKDKNIKITIVQAGSKVIFDKNTYANILWPTVNLEITENILNNNSIVFKLEYKKFSMLFTGDIEEIAEKAIIKNNIGNLDMLKSNVLKVAHHGSKSSTSLSFLEEVQPQIALIGVGKNNMFKHPSATTLENLEKLNVSIYRTDENGEITIRVRENGMYNLEKFGNNKIKVF